MKITKKQLQEIIAEATTTDSPWTAGHLRRLLQDLPDFVPIKIFVNGDECKIRNIDVGAPFSPSRERSPKSVLVIDAGRIS